MSMWIRIFELIMSFTAGKSAAGFSEKSLALTEAVVNKIRHMIILIVVAIGALSLFCVGVSMTVSDLLKNIDLNGSFTSTATFIGGFAMTLITLATLFHCLREKTWMRATGIDQEKREEKQQAAPQPSPIENALALLITDFVQERQRDRTQTHPTEEHQP